MELDPHEYLRDLRAFLGRRSGRRRPARRGQPARRASSGSSSATRTATSCTCCSTSSGCRRPTCPWPAGRRPDRRALLARAPIRRPRRRGRRSCATTTSSPWTSCQRRRARRGLRRLRPRPGHAALRSRAASAPPADARRRPASDPHGLQPDVLPAGDRRRSSTARRSAWVRTSPSTAGSPCAPRCSGPTARRPASPLRPPTALCRPLPTTGDFGPDAVNVRRPARPTRDSLLNWFERLIRLRKELPEIGWGDCTVLDAGDAGGARAAPRVAGPGAGDGAQPRRSGGHRRHRRRRCRRRRQRALRHPRRRLDPHAALAACAAGSSPTASAGCGSVPDQRV